ncbi:transporter associated domain-containing protein [Fibrobacterota bacterium]
MKLAAVIMERPNQVLTSLLSGNTAVNIMVILVEKVLNCSFPKGDYSTLGGFLMTVMDSIPRKKEWLVAEGMKFYIDEAKPNKIVRVFIQRKGAEP